MNKFLILILFVASFAASGEVRKLPSHCSSSSVHQIERPIYPDSIGPTFTYRFNVSQREDKNSPLIIFIPGGPGQTSMDMGLSYPYEFSIVRTDPRGMGCNEDKNLPSESLSSLAIAEDILALIRELKPKRYFIHGISHGTIVATMVAALAEKESDFRPEAVILEGTIGRVYKPGEYLEGFFKRWETVKSQLPKKLQTRLMKEEHPFGLTGKEWAAWLSSILIYGILPSGSDYALDQLVHLDSIKQQTTKPSEAKERIYKEIACREFVPDVRDVKFDLNWSKGNLIDSGLRLCTGTTLNRAFDAKNFKVKSPIYYFSGGLDPVTPPAHARYHFDSGASHRTLISIPQGGHTAFSTNLSDCSSDVWLGFLASDQSQVKKALKSCSLPSIVESK
jgi:pimeloyl-ACP methyl ester carboxylesterase